MALALLSGLLLFGILWALVLWEFTGPLPSYIELQNIEQRKASEVYAADGQSMGKFFVENRTPVDYHQIAPHLIEAVLAVEDVRFFNHQGIDWRAMMRVLFKSILIGDEASGGGSTITQQLAKNLYPRKRYGLFSLPINKFREITIARRLELIYTKEEILELYLNTVPFGGNIFGVEVACKQFFNSNSRDIKIEEAAVLAGMLKGTSRYNPIRNKVLAYKRRNLVLFQMFKYNYLNRAQLDSLLELELTLNPQRENYHAGIAPYFRAFVKEKAAELLKGLKKEDGEDYNLFTDGLKIYTTIDPVMQAYAEKAVQKHMAGLQKTFDEHWAKRQLLKDKDLQKFLNRNKEYRRWKKQGLSKSELDSMASLPRGVNVFSWNAKNETEMSLIDSIRYYYQLLNAGFLAMEPQTGHIKAWVGGIDHRYFQYDHVLAKRQVGSTFKPIVYACALQQEIPPCEYIENRLVTYTEDENWKPENADGQYGGEFSMAGGLSKSVNSIAVSLIKKTGPEAVAQLAHELGVDSEIPEVPSIALGTAELSLLEMIQVYTTFANVGMRVDPIFILRIEDNNGNVLVDQEGAASPKRVLNREDALMLRHMMEAVVDSGTARKLRYEFGLFNDLAGKTGTTQSQADGWFIGFTPKLVAGCWVGGAYPSVRFRSLRLGQGASTALPIFGHFMASLKNDRASRPYLDAFFPEIPYYLLEEMNCPPFREEEPEPEIGEPIDSLIDYFRKLKEQKKNDKWKKFLIFPLNSKKRRGQ